MERGWWIVYAREVGQKLEGYVSRHADEEDALDDCLLLRAKFPDWVFWVQWTALTDEGFQDGKVAL